MDEIGFKERLKRDGYAEGGIVEWAPNTFIDTHTHEFSASVLVLDGEITVKTADGATTCRKGDTFRLAAGTPHSEQVGPDGVRFLSGRK